MYVREFGSLDRGYLPGSLEAKIKSIVKSNESQQWGDILNAAESNPVLAEMLEQVKILYLSDCIFSGCVNGNKNSIWLKQFMLQLLH